MDKKRGPSLRGRRGPCWRRSVTGLCNGDPVGGDSYHLAVFIVEVHGASPQDAAGRAGDTVSSPVIVAGGRVEGAGRLAIRQQRDDADVGAVGGHVVADGHGFSQDVEAVGAAVDADRVLAGGTATAGHADGAGATTTVRRIEADPVAGQPVAVPGTGIDADVVGGAGDEAVPGEGVGVGAQGPAFVPLPVVAVPVAEVHPLLGAEARGRPLKANGVTGEVVGIQVIGRAVGSRAGRAG